MQFGRVHKILPVGLQNTQRKILRNFVKFYLDVDKIAVAMDKICSSLDKIARDNRQNSVKISRLADWIPTLPCYLMRAVFIARTKGGLWVLILERKLSCFPLLPLGVLARIMRG